MPRRPDMPCRRCGELMWRGKGTLPQGEAMCQPCRRVEPQRTTAIKTPCVDCAAPSLGVRCRPCAHINSRDGKTPEQILEAQREVRRRRAARDRLAPGLTPTQRQHLRAEWIKQRKVCTYCPAVATQVDHVIPLALGGTNYIGNLAPCCAECNRAKCDNLLIEWRTGKKARRMHWQVPTDPCLDCAAPSFGERCGECRKLWVASTAKPKRASLCKIHSGTCERCQSPFTAKTQAKRFCSELCMRGAPTIHYCADCDVAIDRHRTKCDPCRDGSALRVRRLKRRKYRDSDAGKRQRREQKRRRAARKRLLIGGGAGVGATAA